jgi:CubicO group peptidase (beta-lactamase class C family)
LIQEILTDWKVPGMGLSVVIDGEVALSQGFGYRNMEGRLGGTPYTLFPIASATKAFTAMSLAVLADDGKLDWNRPVGRLCRPSASSIP